MARQSAIDTALLAAAAEGRWADVTTLIKQGAAMEARDSFKRTPLLVAAAAGHVITVQMLLAAGANVQAEQLDGETALHLAAAGGHDRVVQVLLRYGADKEARTGTSETPLLVASCAGHVAAMQALLSGNADTGATDVGGNSAIHRAASRGQEAAVRLLLAAGFNMEARSGGGRTPAHVAAAEGHAELVCTLAKLGADINAKDDSGHSPLHLFLRQAAITPVEQAVPKLHCLLGMGADAVPNGRPALNTLLCLGHGTLFIAEPQIYIPAFIRELVAAGCPVQAGGHSYLLLNWQAHHLKATWPREPGPAALAVTRTLLQVAAAAGCQGHHQSLTLAVLSGSVAMVESVVGSFPDIVACQTDAGRSDEPVCLATAMLCSALSRLPSPAPEAVLWPAEHRAAALQYCQLVRALLAAGCRPARCYMGDATEHLLEGAHYLRSAVRYLPDSFQPSPMPPWWAANLVRDLLLLVAGGHQGSPAGQVSSHHAYPPAVRAILREVLLVNACRGFPTLPPTPAPRQQQEYQQQEPQHHCASRGTDGCAATSVPLAQPTSRVFLPAGVMRHIIELAASTPEAWLQELNVELAQARRLKSQHKTACAHASASITSGALRNWVGAGTDMLAHPLVIALAAAGLAGLVVAASLSHGKVTAVCSGLGCIKFWLA